MRVTSARVGRMKAILFASTVVIAGTQAWLPGANGFSPADDPISPYYLGEIAPPSWQGRPWAIPELGE
jgi:hypothetical protein